MIIKKRFKKLSLDFIENIFICKMKDNYIYWVEDNNGKRVSDDFTYNKRFEFGPFIIMEKTLTLSFATLKDKDNDSLYIEGNLYYNECPDGKHYFIYNSDTGYLVDINGHIIEKDFMITDNLSNGYLIYQNGLYGYMDYNAKITVKPQFKRINTGKCFNNDFIGEYPDGGKIHMNILGETLSAKIYTDSIYPFDDKLLYSVENGLIGLIDSDGKVILPCRYKELKKLSLNPNWLIAKNHIYYGIIDKNGIVIKEFVCSEITEDIKNKQLILKEDTIMTFGT